MFCFIVAGWRGLSGRSTVNKDQVVAIAQSQIGIREATGNNDGRQVEAYLAVAGLKKGQPWCAAFVSWIFKKAGYQQPVTGWSPALFPQQKLVKLPRVGLVFGIYFPSLKRIAHCGLVETVNGNWLSCIEGNTNVTGKREGDGVYRKLRHVKTIYSYSDWRNNNSKKEGAVL